MYRVERSKHGKYGGAQRHDATGWKDVIGWTRREVDEEKLPPSREGAGNEE